MKTQDNRIDVRVSSDVKTLLQEAAESRHKSVSEFMRDSAIRRANEILQDRSRMTLSPSDWEHFIQALDAPPRPAPRLEKLFQEPSPFEE